MPHLRPVCRSHNHNPLPGARGHPLKLEEELCLDPPHPLVFPRPPLTQQRVYLINEDDRGLDVPGHAEQSLDELLPLAEPLAGQAARADVDQVAARLCCQGARKQRFSIAWKSFVTKG